MKDALGGMRYHSIQDEKVQLDPTPPKRERQKPYAARHGRRHQRFAQSIRVKEEKIEGYSDARVATYIFDDATVLKKREIDRIPAHRSRVTRHTGPFPSPGWLVRQPGGLEMPGPGWWKQLAPHGTE
jgi:hypothetical protein